MVQGGQEPIWKVDISGVSGGTISTGERESGPGPEPAGPHDHSIRTADGIGHDGTGIGIAEGAIEGIPVKQIWIGGVCYKRINSTRHFRPVIDAVSVGVGNQWEGKGGADFHAVGQSEVVPGNGASEMLI